MRYKLSDSPFLPSLLGGNAPHCAWAYCIHEYIRGAKTLLSALNLLLNICVAKPPLSIVFIIFRPHTLCAFKWRYLHFYCAPICQSSCGEMKCFYLPRLSDVPEETMGLFKIWRERRWARFEECALGEFGFVGRGEIENGRLFKALSDVENKLEKQSGRTNSDHVISPSSLMAREACHPSYAIKGRDSPNIKSLKCSHNQMWWTLK